jgi:hypothetical protein
MEVDPLGKPEPDALHRPDNELPDAEPQSSETYAFPRCPNCGWQDVRPSHSRSAFGMALSLFSIAAFRCRSCSHRFYRFHRKAHDL